MCGSLRAAGLVDESAGEAKADGKQGEQPACGETAITPVQQPLAFCKLTVVSNLVFFFMRSQNSRFLCEIS